MICVEVATDGSVFVVDPQPVDTSSCLAVLVSGDQVGSDLTLLTAEQGTQIAASVLFIWSLAFVIRLCVRTLSIDEVKEL